MLDYGFSLSTKHGSYICQRDLDEEDFYVVFEITAASIESHVFEKPEGEEYLPYDRPGPAGAFTSDIRAQVEAELDKIVKACFELADPKTLLLEYAKDEYGTIFEEPWDNSPGFYTLKTANSQKWYGIFMIVSKDKLGLEGDEKIDVLNVKLSPEHIEKLIDRTHYFPAYHMNKKYWMSVMLDRTTDIEEVKRLLDESYLLVEAKKKR